MARSSNKAAGPDSAWNRCALGVLSLYRNRGLQFFEEKWAQARAIF
jgi:hypothetical protein